MTLRKTIRVVCSDMYEGYINAVKEVLGKGVQVVVDRFHVAKLYRQGLDKLPAIPALMHRRQ